MKKTYILDTNVILSSPNAIFAFEDNDVIIPDVVLEELDSKKKGQDEINFSARQVSRYLYDIKSKLKGQTLYEKVTLDTGGTLRIVSADDYMNIKLPDTWQDDKHDNLILKVCRGLTTNDKLSVILVTNDILMAIKADYWNIKNEQYQTDRIKLTDKCYTGQINLYTNEQCFNEFANCGCLNLDNTYIYNENYQFQYDWDRYPNCFVTLIEPINNTTLLGRISQDTKTLKKLQYTESYPFGVSPKNKTQKFMIEALMDPTCPLVVLSGPAGSAKTFLSLAAGLEKVFEGNTEQNEYYRKMLICRPNQLLEDLGYLPGTEQEKIQPLFKGIYDNLSTLIDSSKESRLEDSEEELNDKVNELINRRIINFESLAYIRGRSITDTYFIVDEIQNADFVTLKTILTRLGTGSKIVVTGDLSQIDNPYLDQYNSGLAILINKMKQSKLCSIVVTNESDSVRSELASEAIRLLK